MFIITKVGNKIIIRRTFRRDKSCDVFIFFAGDAFFDLSHFESIGSKSPIELEGLSFCYPKNME